MQQLDADIERIVREVVARLGGVAGGMVALPTCECGGGTCRVTNPLPGPAIRALESGAMHTMTLEDRVVTTQSFDGKLDHAEQIVIRSDAILTPAARDLLAERGIRWKRQADGLPGSPAGDAAATPAVPSGNPEVPRIVVGGCGCRIEQQAALDAATAGGGWCVERTELGELVPLVERMAGRVTDGSCRALLVTDRPALAVCLANRHHSVRAVHVRNQGEVQAAVDSVNPNLLVIDAGCGDAGRLREMLDRYRTCRWLDCPKEYAEQLG